MASQNAAYTIRKDLDEVRELGIEITQENSLNDFDGKILGIEEVNLTKLEAFLTDLNEALSDVDVVAVAVQDS